MPRKKQPVHSYSVYLTSWASNETREQARRPSSPEQLVTRTLYRGSSERQAAWFFYQAAQAAMTDPLALSITMRRDGREFLRLTP
jgi:hypothetical protein